MPRPRPPYLHREVTRHGKPVWYFRRSKEPRIRLRADYGTPEFQAEYDTALAGEAAKAKPRASSGSLQWLYERYRETVAWRDLSAGTRRGRENIFSHVMATAGSDPCREITRAHIEEGKDKRRNTPAQARNFLDAMRGLFRWARAAGHVSQDPTEGVKNPGRQPGAGFAVWTEEEVDRYEARWPIGSRQRVWLGVLVYTGLRRGDAVRIGKQHVRNGVATIRTEKSQEKVTVTIPILPVLAEILAAGPCGDLAFICGERGEPLTKESFGNVFRVACREAGINKSAHGVRKMGATRAANNGATVAELEAIFGWQGGGMAALYTREADRARLARSAMGKMMRTPEQHPMLAPSKASPAPK